MKIVIIPIVRSIIKPIRFQIFSGINTLISVEKNREIPRKKAPMALIMKAEKNGISILLHPYAEAARNVSILIITVGILMMHNIKSTFRLPAYNRISFCRVPVLPSEYG